MSLNDYKGAAWAYRQLMQQVQAEIDRGERKGVTVRWKRPARTVRLPQKWAWWTRRA